MTNRGETIWPIKPHTKAKHAILRRYLQAWFPILNSGHSKLVYIDGFAGPGEYTGGESGSPIVALSVVQNHTAELRGEFHFLFVEKRTDRFAHLKAIIDEQEFPPGYEVKLFNDEFSQVLRDVLEDPKYSNTPIFAFVDPFGVAGVHYDLITQLLGRRSTEAFILFAREAVNRWLEHENVRGHIEALYGLETIVIPGGVDRLGYLRNLYRDRLAEIATYVGYFTMQDINDRPIYDLFFVSNKRKGYVKMKEAMWSVDDQHGFRFSDADHPSQVVLFKHNPAEQLADDINHGGAGRSSIDVADIRAYVEKNTIYLAKHMRAALRILEEEERINVRGKKADGSTRRKGTFPDGTLFDFLDE
jgi:three-Cys-motif partner protein